MASPFLGQISLFGFNFAPRGWAFCQGQILAISQNQALFALLGTTYGGNGQTTFALPNLQGRLAVGWGQGAGLSNYDLGQTGGEDAHTLNISELAAHNHAITASSNPGSIAKPAGQELAAAPAAAGNLYGSTPGGSSMPAAMIQSDGGSQPHNNLMPTLTLNYCIALVGIFPSQT